MHEIESAVAFGQPPFERKISAVGSLPASMILQGWRDEDDSAATQDQGHRVHRIEQSVPSLAASKEDSTDVFSETSRAYIEFSEPQTVLDTSNKPSREQHLAKLIDHPPDIEKNATQAIERWIGAARRGDIAAQFNLGCAYAVGWGVKLDARSSVEWFIKAAHQGAAEAQFNLGVIHTLGDGVEQNVDAAIKWYRQSAAGGIAMAAHNLGVIYDQGVGVAHEAREAVAWYRRAAEQGLAMAQHNLAVCYTSGAGINKDLKEAAKWFRKAADQDNALSQHNLGVIYDQGSGVDRNAQKAVTWYRKSAEQGFVNSQYMLGVKYAEGEGTTKNLIEAFCWIRYAAEQAHANSQCLLASMYFAGQGVYKDCVEAYKWATLALKHGAVQKGTCIRMRNDIAKELTTDDLQRSERIAENWKCMPWTQIRPTGYTAQLNHDNNGPRYHLIGPILFINELINIWKLCQNDTIAILGFKLSEAHYVRELLSGNRALIEGSETEDRIAYLIYIRSILSELFHNRDFENKWLRSPNSRLAGKAPIELLRSGTRTDLLLVQELVDLVSGRS